jgi:hypothetical protein
MAVKTVFEILRRGANGPVHVGMVTDKFLATQVIDRLYEKLRQVVLSPSAELVLGEANFTASPLDSVEQGWDQWSVNDRNSPTPTFWTRPKYLWNSVPSNMVGWLLVEQGDEFSAFVGDIPNVIAELDPKP